MRSFLLWIGTITMVVSIALMINWTMAKMNNLSKVKMRINKLSSISLVTLDSINYELEKNSLVLIFYNSSCDHCQYEAKQIKKSINAFGQAKIIMVSSESIKEIKEFSVKYGLSGNSHIVFTKIKPEDVYDTFGSISIPHIFIYNKSHKLVKEFRGETRIEAILKYLP